MLLLHLPIQHVQQAARKPLPWAQGLLLCGAFVNKPTGLPLADVTCGNKPWEGQDRKGRALHQVEVKGYSSCTRKHKVEFPSGKQLNFLKQEHWEE